MAEPHDDWLIFTAASIRNLNRIGIAGMSRADDLVSFVSPRLSPIRVARNCRRATLIAHEL